MTASSEAHRAERRQQLGVMSDSGEQNYGERVRRGAVGGGCVVPSSYISFQAHRPWTGRRAISAPKSKARRIGVGLKKPLWIVFLFVKNATGRFMWPRTRVGGFFCYKGE